MIIEYNHHKAIADAQTPQCEPFTGIKPFSLDIGALNGKLKYLATNDGNDAESRIFEFEGATKASSMKYPETPSVYFRAIDSQPVLNNNQTYFGYFEGRYGYHFYEKKRLLSKH